MWRAVVAGTAALAIAGSSLAFAQSRSGRDGGQRWQPSMEDMRAFGEARLAALKAGLALTTEQERNWPAFEQAAREFGRLRLERMKARRDAPPTTDRVERLRQRATAMSDKGAALRRLADATDPLYNSLDDSQKRRFEMLSRFAGPGRHHLRGRHDGYNGRDDDDDDQFRGRDYDGPRHHWRRSGMEPMDEGTSGRRRL
jgi:zinc resistance-associated protein